MATSIAVNGSDIDGIVVRLSTRFAVHESVVRSFADEAALLFANARIRSFVPLLVERETRQALIRAGFGCSAADVAREAPVPI